MKKKILALGIFIVLFGGIFVGFKKNIIAALTPYNLSKYDTSIGRLRVNNLATTASTDSTLYLNGNTNEVRRGAPITSILSGYATISQLSNIKTPVTYSGVTNASGVYTVTFPVAYATPPNIQASITNQTNVNQAIRVTSVSATGFTVNVFQRNAVTLLATEVLLATVVNVNGANVDVLVTPK